MNGPKVGSHINYVYSPIASKVPKSDEEYNLSVPRDMAYTFSGAYVPLSCKLIEQVGYSSIIHSLLSTCVCLM